jgi:hypothetical protein
MRVSFVSKERIEMRTKEAFFYRGMLFIVNLLVLLAIVLLFVFLTRQNRLPFLIILCILGVFLLCYDYFEVAYRLLPLGKYLSFLKKMSGAESQEVEGDVLLLHESVSSPYGVRFLPFLLKTSSTQEEYLLSLAEGVSLKVGQHLTFSSSDHYVVGLESAEEEVLPLGDKSTIRRHFRHQGWVYLLLSAAVSLSFVYGASIKLQPSSKEKLRLFFMVYASEESALRDYVFSKRDDTLLQVEVLTYSPEVSSRGVILSTAGLVDTDFLLLPSDVFSEEELALHVAPIDETI